MNFIYPFWKCAYHGFKFQFYLLMRCVADLKKMTYNICECIHRMACDVLTYFIYRLNAVYAGRRDQTNSKPANWRDVTRLYRDKGVDIFLYLPK